MRTALVRVAAISLLALLWYCVTLHQSPIQQLRLPSPLAVYTALRRNGAELISYSGITLARVVIGYLLGAPVGIAVALLMLYSKAIAGLLDTYIEILRPIPPIALTPFFIFWFGIGNLGQILLVAMVAFLVFAITLYESGNSFERRYIRAARSLGASRSTILLRVILPGSLPQLGAAARLAVAGSVAATVAAEYLGAQGGLGYMIRNARMTLETDAIFVAVLALSCLSVSLDYITRITFRWLTAWAPKDVATAYVMGGKL